MGRASLAMVVVGGILCYFGFKEWQMREASSAEPERISLQKLIARGPEGNPYVLLTDFEWCDDVVYEHKGGSAPWEKCWIPVVPSGGAPAAGPFPGPRFGPGAPERPAGPSPTAFRAIVMTSKVNGPGAVPGYTRQTTLKGLVTNSVMSLGSKERDLLKQGYPNTDFDKCIIIQDGREPAGPGMLAALLGGGTALFGGGLVIGLMALVKARQG
jgi:hypothetical protein